MTFRSELESQSSHRLRRRMIITLIVVAAVLGALYGFNLFKGHMIAKSMAENSAPAATVSVAKAEYQQWQPQLNAVGTLRAVHGVDVTTEVAGIVRSVNFKSGDEVKAGEVLAQLNADSDIALLHSLEAEADLAKSVFERDSAQLEARAISKAQLDMDAANLKSKQAQVAQQAALVQKKTLRAPFAGKLGISKVNPGQYLNPADPLVTLQSIDPIYVDFFVPQRELPKLAVKQALNFSTDTFTGTQFVGRITAINPKVDTDTRNVQIEAALENQQHRLLPGMFGNVSVDVDTQQRYLTLPQTAVIYNPYGSTVFTVKDTGKKDDKGKPILQAQQSFVKTGPTRGDQVAILEGISPDTQVITSGGFKLKNGTPLIIDNSLQPSNDPNPRPQER